jgi:methylenetetrahydrofolate dehydrogenase (NADP+)/methenyltetrahydrofolate cyclohydrolase
MTARILDGRALALTMQSEIAAQVADQIKAGGPKPGLAAVQVGDNDASTRYIRGKIEACDRVGVAGFRYHLPVETTEPQLLNLLERLNSEPDIHGILVQLPLPEQINEHAIINAVLPTKDVDGFHPVNQGLLAGGNPRFVPCTPLGIQQLLIRSGIATEGARIVVIGRSNIVGKPMALLLLGKGPGGDATVTVAHSKSRNLPEITRTADILIAAIGRAHFVTADMVKPGATVIDVGINRTSKGKLAGDVDFQAVSKVAGAITPVPGGIGPMTITMLLHNTLRASQIGRGNL